MGIKWLDDGADKGAATGRIRWLDEDSAPAPKPLRREELKGLTFGGNEPGPVTQDSPVIAEARRPEPIYNPAAPESYWQEQGRTDGSISAPLRPAPGVGSVTSGLASEFGAGVAQVRSGINEATLDAVPLAPGETQFARGLSLKTEQQRSAAARFEADLARPEFDGFGGDLYDAGSSVVQTLPSIGAGLLTTAVTGNPIAGAGVGISLAAGQTGAQAYDKYRSRGASPKEAAAGAAIEGGFEALGEKIPMGILVEKFGKRGAAKFIGEYLIAEGVTENLTTIAQDAVDTAIANPDKTWGQFIKERPQAAYQTTLATLMTGGLLGGASAGVERLTRPTPPTVRETAVAEAAQPTPEDTASPLDTADVTAGRTVIADAVASGKASQALTAQGLPEVGKPVVITKPDGSSQSGTMHDYFEGADGSGLVVKLDGGTELRAHFDDLTDAGWQITAAQSPREQADAIDAELAARAAEPLPISETTAELRPQPVAPPETPSSGSPSTGGATTIDGYMAKTRRAESGVQDNRAKNPRSSAEGRYQFTDGTWLATYRRHFGNGESDADILAKKGDGALQDTLMRDLTEANAATLKRNGVPITDGNLYLAHFAGEGGAVALHKADPNTPVEQVLGAKAVAANPFLKGKSAADVIQWAAGKMGGRAATSSTVQIASAEQRETDDVPLAEPNFAPIEDSAPEKVALSEQLDAAQAPQDAADAQQPHVQPEAVGTAMAALLKGEEVSFRSGDAPVTVRQTASDEFEIHDGSAATKVPATRLAEMIESRVITPALASAAPTVPAAEAAEAPPPAAREVPRAEEAEAPASAPFDAAAWQGARDERIASSRAAGNTHLDQVEPAVETMRGREFYNVHDPKERGVVRTVANTGDVVVHWADDYTAEKNLAEAKVDRGKPVHESWLMPTDLKDYVFAGKSDAAVPTSAISPIEVPADRPIRIEPTTSGKAIAVHDASPEQMEAIRQAVPQASGVQRKDGAVVYATKYRAAIERVVAPPAAEPITPKWAADGALAEMSEDKLRSTPELPGYIKSLDKGIKTGRNVIGEPFSPEQIGRLREIRTTAQGIVDGGVHADMRAAAPAPAKPVDVLEFIASNGGLRDDEGHNLGLALPSKEATRGMSQGALQDARRRRAFGTRDWKKFTKAGPLLRHKGQSVDAIGEKLHEAGYLRGQDGGRPSEAEVLDFIDRRIQGGKPAYPEGAQVDEFSDIPDDVEAEARAHESRRVAIDAAADRLGLEPLTEDFSHMAADVHAALPHLTPDEALLRAINEQFEAVRARAFEETQDPAYDGGEHDWPTDPELGNEALASEGDGGRQAPVAEDAQGREAGSADVREGGRPQGLDAGAAVDPAIAERQRQEAKLRAEAPLRGANKTGQEQDGTMGLGLFDTSDQKTFELERELPSDTDVNGGLTAAASSPRTPPAPDDAAAESSSQADQGDRSPDALPASGAAVRDGRIEDFGEKLEGARKDYAQSYKDRMAQAAEVDVTAEPLSKSWPEPDYQKLLDDGADPYTVAWIHAARDEIPTKPQKGWKLKGWAENVTALRDLAADLLAERTSSEALRSKMRHPDFNRIVRNLDGRVTLFEAVGHGTSLKGISFSHNHYSLYRGQRDVTLWVIEQKAKATAFSNWPREIVTAQTREDAIAQFKAKLAEGALDPKRKRNEVVRFDIYSYPRKPGFYIGKKIGRGYVDLKHFDTAKEARAFKISDDGYAELVAALEKFKDIPPERKEVNSPRIGYNHRSGADVTPEGFMEAFGFRGVQFGNYVEGPRRQADLNQAYDALMDLAGVLGVPARALSLNGELGLAFGARGKGGKFTAAAHYEPDTIVINLTKGAGAGSLAHEWWHSLDNYFARSTGSGLSYATTGLVKTDGIRPEMVEAFKSVMTAIRQTAVSERSKNLDKRRTKDYWSTDVEMSARSFESYVIAKLEDQEFANDYLANIVSEQAFAIENGYPYPTAAEIPVIRAGFDHFFQTAETRETEKGVALYSRSAADLPTVSVKASDWGPLPRSPLARYRALRERVERWYGGLVGTTVTTRDGKEVHFNSRGREKTLRAGEDLLGMARAIPKILERGVLVGSEPGRDNRVKAAHRYAANVRDDNGKTLPVVLVVRETPDGMFHYSLNKYVEGASDAPAETGGVGPKASAPALEGGAEDSLNLEQFDEFRNDAAPVVTSAPTRADLDAAFAELRPVLDKMGLAHVRLRVRAGTAEMGGANGRFWPMSNLIEVALDAPNGRDFVLHHEGLHALREAGVFSAGDWQIVTAAVRGMPELMASIRQRYPDLTREQQLEEAVADLFGDYQANRGTFTGTMERLLARVARLLSALRNGLRGRGFTSARTFYEVFGEAASGKLARGVTEPPGDVVVDEPKESRSREDTTALASLGGSDPTWKGQVSERFDTWRTRMQDRYLPLLRVEQTIERITGKTLPDELNPYMGEEIMSGRIAAGIDTLADDHVGPLFDAMHAEGITTDELETYLYARHAPERNARMSEINPEIEEGAGSGMTDLQAAAIMGRIRREGRMEAMERLAARVDAIRDMTVERQVESGLVSKDQAAEWKKTYKNYVPLRGFKEVEGDPEFAQRINRSGGGINVRGSESKAAFGRRSEADSPLSYLIMQAEEAIVRGETNRVAQRFIALAKENPDEEFWQVNKVTAKQRINPETGLVERYLSHNLAAADKDWTVSAKIGGVETRVTMNRANPAAARLADAMRNLTQHQLDWFTMYVGKVNRFLSTVNTSLNPEFVITNAFRDLSEATINLGGVDVKGIQARVLKSYPSAIKAAMKGAFGKENGEWGTWYREFTNAGGRVAFNQIDNIEKVKERLVDAAEKAAVKAGEASAMLKAKHLAYRVRDTVEGINSGVENAVRLATYRAAREAGLSQDRAASMAKGITINFNRRGTFGPAMNALYLFYNASAQGSVRILQAMRSPRVRRTVAGIMVAGFLIEMLNAMVSDDDDDGQSYWDKISDFDKSHNMIVALGGSKFLKIPMPYGYGAFYNAGRTAGEIARRGGKDWQASLGGAASSFIDAFNPIGGGNLFTPRGLISAISPTITDPIVDLAFNRNFADKPIMPDQKPYGPPTPDHDRYWDNVAPHWKSVTEFLNEASGGDAVVPGAVDVSPATLEYLSGTLFGAAGGFAERVFSLPEKARSPDGVNVNDVPFARKLVAGKSASFDKSAYYDRLQQIEQTVQDTKEYIEAGQMDEARSFAAHHEKVLSLRSVGKAAKREMSAIRKAKHQVEAARDHGKIDAATYAANKLRIHDAEAKVITAFNTRWNETMNGQSDSAAQ